MADRLISVNELAKILGVPTSWVYSRTRVKGPDAIPTIRVGKYVKFQIDAVMEWLHHRNQAE